MGGIATVYLAQDLKHDRPVALKLLRPELAAIIGGARFLQEIETTAQLQHPHILGLIDSGRPSIGFGTSCPCRGRVVAQPDQGGQTVAGE